MRFVNWIRQLLGMKKKPHEKSLTVYDSSGRPSRVHHKREKK